MIIDDGSPSSLPTGGCLDRLRTALYSCLTRRGDALFELMDAVSCASAPVTALARLSLEIEHQRGHGGLYDALNAGEIDTGRPLCSQPCATPLPKVTGPDGRERIVLAVDVSNWLRLRRGDQPGAVVLPHLRPRCRAGADDPGLGVLLRVRAGDRSVVVDGAAGCGADPPCGGRHRRDRRPAAGGDRRAHRLRALPGRGSFRSWSWPTPVMTWPAWPGYWPMCW